MNDNANFLLELSEHWLKDSNYKSSFEQNKPTLKSFLNSSLHFIDTIKTENYDSFSSKVITITEILHNLIQLNEVIFDMELLLLISKIVVIIFQNASLSYNSFLFLLLFYLI